MGAAGGAAAASAAHAASIANAIKASGAIVRVEPEVFLSLLARTPDTLVVVSEGGVFRKHYKYLAPMRGLIFTCKSPQPLELPRGTDVLLAKAIWIPD